MNRADLVARLRSALSAGRWSAGEKLPSVQTLAKHYHCSPVTLLAALRVLSAEGLVASSPGRAYTVTAAKPATTTSAPEHADVPSSRLFAAETIAATLREEILSGSAPAVLPSAKELRKRFGCSHRTLVRALARLEASSLLQRRGSHYVTGTGATSGAATHVYCLSDSLPASGLLVSGSFLSFVMGLEREVEAHGWGRLRFVAAADRRRKMPPLHQVAGFVHFQASITDEWSDFLSKPMPAPAAVVDLHEAGPADGLVHPNLYRIFPDNVGAGRDIGRHLAALGHKRCAYLSHLTLAEGCGRMRLQGLTQVFPTLASRHGRGCVVFDGSGLEWPSQAAMGQVNTTLERLRSVVLGESGLNEAFVRQSFDEAFGAVTWWSRYAGLAALFQSALADRSITAWVCATDNLAMLAHSFLAKNGVTPGKDVSLASFDNSWLSHGLGITSYDFGFDRMGRLAFHCLAAPQQVVRPGRTIVHAPGQLVTRASTGDQ